MSYPRERLHDKGAEDFHAALMNLAGTAHHLGLADYAGVLDALADGAAVRLGLPESSDDTDAMFEVELRAVDRDVDAAIERRRDDALDGGR